MIYCCLINWVQELWASLLKKGGSCQAPENPQHWEVAKPQNCRVLSCAVVRCRVSQCVAVCCSVLQCVAVCCRVLSCVVVCCSVLSCVVVCCRVLPCVAVCCSVLQCVAVCCNVLQCVAACYSVLRYVAVCCSVLQVVAVCCSVLQCVAVYYTNHPQLTYASVTSHVNESRPHVWEQVTSCEGMSHVKYMSESRYIRMSLITHTNGSCHTHGWVISQINESCHNWMDRVTRERVMSYVWTSALLCFIKPILGNRYGPWVSSLASQGSTYQRLRIAVMPHMNHLLCANGGDNEHRRASNHLSATVLLNTAEFCSSLQCDVVYCNVFQCVAACCSVLLCATACCSVLQCAAVCCSVL